MHDDVLSYKQRWGEVYVLLGYLVYSPPSLRRPRCSVSHRLKVGRCGRQHGETVCSQFIDEFIPTQSHYLFIFNRFLCFRFFLGNPVLGGTGTIWHFSTLASYKRFSIKCRLLASQIQVVSCMNVTAMQTFEIESMRDAMRCVAMLYRFDVVYNREQHFPCYLCSLPGVEILRDWFISKKKQHKLFTFSVLVSGFSGFQLVCGLWVVWGKLNNKNFLFLFCFLQLSCCCDNILPLKYIYFPNKFSIWKFTCNRSKPYRFRWSRGMAERRHPLCRWMIR